MILGDIIRMHLMSDVSDSESEPVLDASVGKKRSGNCGFVEAVPYRDKSRSVLSFSVLSALSFPEDRGVSGVT